MWLDPPFAENKSKNSFFFSKIGDQIQTYVVKDHGMVWHYTSQLVQQFRC